MFISFGLFIGLIILTIFMITLLIYLILSSGKDDNKLKKIGTLEQQAKAMITKMPENTLEKQIHLDSDVQVQINDFQQKTELTETVLPNPKDEAFK